MTDIRLDDIADPSAGATTTVVVAGPHLMAGLLGPRDANLRLIERAFPDAKVSARGNEVSVQGPDAANAGRVFEELAGLLERGYSLDERTVERSIAMVRDDEKPTEVLTHEVLKGAKGRHVRPKTAGQKRYVDAIRNNIITFGIGPAGTGKSWLAVAMAVQALQAKEVQRIILTRPAVEAGERLGFLPGDLMAKIDPYLRPLYDALYDMVDLEGAQRLIDRGTVEVAPLAFMRGRTLNDAFIILDEAQNTTPAQMKMFLTRIGFNSKVVVTGDTTQVDVDGGRSGLDGLERKLGGIDGLAFVHLTGADVVRHRIVADIVAAYDAGAARVTNLSVPVNVGDEPSHPVTVVAADEQSDVAVDLQRWARLARLAAEYEGAAGELTLTFIDRDEITDLNHTHMGVDGPTDVLSFPLDVGDDPVVDLRLLGDIVVCPAVAHSNAPDHAGSPDDEIALLVVHGVLHILGHDHGEPAETARMQAREIDLLERFHWADRAPDAFSLTHRDPAASPERDS